jgi:subtilisin family serine protease
MRRVLLLLVVLATAFTFSVPVTGQEQGLTAQALTPDSIDHNKASKGETVRVIVQLEEPALASYDGGIQGIPATSPRVTKQDLNTNSAAARAYLAHLDSRQDAMRAEVARVAPSARLGTEFKVALNAITMTVTVEDAARIAKLDGVAAVLPDRLEQPMTEASPQFIDAPVLWNQLGGQGNAGEGTIVGVLDTGIWPEHPSFADPSPVGGAYPAPPTTPGANGFGSGGPRSTCDFGNTGFNADDAAFTCNNKLIGAYSFLDTYKAIIGLIATEFDSARDSNGHGTHTTSTAAGNGGVAATLFEVDRGTLSGVAPRAHVIMYRVCGLEGCFQSDSVRAVEQAILDGVDVINFSISGGNAPYSDPVSIAFLAAYDAGVLVSASAGNSGPGANTVAHREPWTITVGASTSNRHFLSTVTLTSGEDSLMLTGASVTAGIDTPTEVVHAADFGDGLCLDPFPAGTFDGQIVVCERGVIARVAKSYNVMVGGAAGMLQYNPVLQGLATDNHFIPSVHLENDAGAALLAFMAAATEPVMATFTDGTATEVPGDVMAAFSSRGGSSQPLGISKPDVTAPGVQILAGHTPMPEDVVGGLPGELFQSIQGTSMSSPHTAGAAALVKAANPSWTPGQVKSALMTTALISGVTKENGSTPADAFDMGSGRIDLSKAANPGLTFDESAVNYLALEDRLWDANYPSLYVPEFPGAITVTRKVTSSLSRAGHWTTTVDAPPDLQVSVPSRINVSAGGSRTFEISLDGRAIPIGQTRQARITFTRGSDTLTFPVTVVRSSPVAAVAKSCDPGDFPAGSTSTCTITVENTSFEDAEFTVRDPLPNILTLVESSITGGERMGNGVTFTGTLEAAEPPSPTVVAGGPPFGYISLGGLGVGAIGGVGDETIVNFTVPAFNYAGETYTRIGMVSNGYLVVGGGTAADVDFINQELPDPERPNNVMAPYWTDLNPAAGGAIRVALLTGGANQWIVFEWENVPHWGDGTPVTFQAWVSTAASAADTTGFAYGSIAAGDGGFLTVGAENAFGNRGNSWYFDGAGTLPTNGSTLGVVGEPGEPGETHTITFDVTGVRPGDYTNYVYVTSDTFAGTSITSFSGRVTAR